MKKIKIEKHNALTGIEIGQPAKSAAGLMAVFNSLNYIFERTTIVRGTKASIKLNQKDGFDCPSCAWPDPDHHRSGFAEYCENGAKAIADEIMDKVKADPTLFQKYTVDELFQMSDYWLGQQGRLTEPMILKEGKTNYEPISWPEAFNIISKNLKNLADPNQAIFYTSGRASNEAAFLYQLFVRMFGTNNLPDCSNMCHESSGVALSESIGIGKATIVLDDFPKANLIIILGQNPGTNHPRMLSSLEAAKRKGAKIIAVNPLLEAGLLHFNHPQLLLDLITGGENITDLYLQIKINSDLALLKAWSKILIESSAINNKFINEKTIGFENLKADLAKHSLSELILATGLTESEVMESADLIAKSDKIIACWAMGLTQHKNAVATIQELTNVILLRGSIGKEGAGLCPVRGHSNVQGDRTMGIYEKIKPEMADKLHKIIGFEPPLKNGYNTIEAIEAMYTGKAKVFIGLGGNFYSACPDSDYTRKALENCDLTVHISTKLNRSHLTPGKTALILPCLGRTEKDYQNGVQQFISVENTAGIVHQSKGAIAPISDNLMSETAIVANLAMLTVGTTMVNWQQHIDNYDSIRNLIEKVVDGFENFNVKLKKPGGFYLPNLPRIGQFPTPSGKAVLVCNKWEPISLLPNQFVLMTIRSHDQFNTTIYGLDDRYRGIYNERRVILINEKDIKKHNLQAFQLVNIISHFKNKTRKAEEFILIPYHIPEQCLAAYFPETNVLVPLESKADKSHTPTSKSIIVSLEAVLDNGKARLANVKMR